MDELTKQFKEETQLNVPDLEGIPILVKIENIENWKKYEWYEVVFYYDKRWCDYDGHTTFKDGGRVVKWKYCKDCI